MEPLLKVEHLTVCYDETERVKDVSFSLQKGEVLGIVGESGSGKSTLIRAVMGLLGDSGRITGGSIWYQGKNLTELSQKELRRIRGTQIGMIFQDSQAALCPVRKIGRQIQEAVQSHQKIRSGEVKKQAIAVMEKLGLEDPERIWNSYPFELSGGMNQRVGICMAMMQQPNLLLADEPTSALDVTTQAQIVKEMMNIVKQSGTSMIVVTHNIGVAAYMSDKIMVMAQGTVRDYGPAEEVINHPKDEYTKKLLSAVPELGGERYV